mmetsp:Transcript_28117/g.80947  ORF Transcript_28117/g.80947 Transcript_28117/m.80947 type:complete len:163 (-) Transcript_28117:731-1219(-)
MELRGEPKTRLRELRSRHAPRGYPCSHSSIHGIHHKETRHRHGDAHHTDRLPREQHPCVRITHCPIELPTSRETSTHWLIDSLPYRCPRHTKEAHRHIHTPTPPPYTTHHPLSPSLPPPSTQSADLMRHNTSDTQPATQPDAQPDETLLKRVHRDMNRGEKS